MNPADTSPAWRRIGLELADARAALLRSEPPRTPGEPSRRANTTPPGPHVRRRANPDEGAIGGETPLRGECGGICTREAVMDASAEDVIAGREPWAMIHGRSEVVLPMLPDGCVDAVVTDPPAGISFMGAQWDRFGGRGNKNAAADRDAANQGPGAGLGNQPFGYSGSTLGTRKQRDAFIAFITGVFVEVLRIAKPGAVALVWALPRTSHWTATALEDAGWLIEEKCYHLFGTGFPKHKSKLKPACEEWILCRKPGPKWLGVEECRIETNGEEVPVMRSSGGRKFEQTHTQPNRRNEQVGTQTVGRWPANVVLSEDPEVLEMFPETEGESTPRTLRRLKETTVWSGGSQKTDNAGTVHCDSGSVTRFFYVAKADKADRGRGNNHPTVKPSALMCWLVRLACPAGGLCLDPFAGSGSTGVSCRMEGRRFIGVEQDEKYVAIARRRIAACNPLADACDRAAKTADPDLFTGKDA